MTSQEGFEKAASLKSPINAAYDAVLKAEQNSLDAKIKLGELLNLAKEAVGHGAFGTWLEEHTKISHRSANVYMQLAERKERLDEKSNPQRAAILAAGSEMSVRQALIGIKTPDEIKKAQERADKAKKAKEANKAAKAAESEGNGSIDLYDLLSVADPDEVLKVLTDEWEEEKLTALAKLLAEHLAKLKGKAPTSDIRRPLEPLPTTNDPRLRP